MTNEELKQRAIQAILWKEPTLQLAFTRRSCDGIFARVGRIAAPKPLDHTAAVWYGYEYLADSVYLEA